MFNASLGKRGSESLGLKFARQVPWPLSWETNHNRVKMSQTNPIGEG